MWSAVAVALAIAAGGCQLVVDLDGLEDQHCPPGHKPCPTLGCVPNDNPGTGCNDPGCAPCAPPHAIATCGQNLHCFFNRDSCIPGWDDCDGRPDNGCETDLSHNRDHCGTCTKSCEKPTNGIAGCSNGECGIGGCNPMWEDCDHDPANGCEHPIWTDQECLGCGLPCPDGTSCDQGVCI
jgi:hypothetical protein